MLNCQHHISWIREVPGGLHQCILCTAVVTKKDVSPSLDSLPESFRLRWEAHEATRPAAPEPAIAAAAAPPQPPKPAVATPAPKPATPSAPPKPDVAAEPEVAPVAAPTPRPAIPRAPPMRPGIPPPAASWDPTSHR